MTSNGAGLNNHYSCKLCMLLGQFEATDRNGDPIEELVNAAGVNFLPWKGDGEPKSASDFSFATFSCQMDELWQHERVINFKRDEVANLTNEYKERNARAQKAEDNVSDAVR